VSVAEAEGQWCLFRLLFHERKRLAWKNNTTVCFRFLERFSSPEIFSAFVCLYSVVYFFLLFSQNILKTNLLIYIGEVVARIFFSLKHCRKKEFFLSSFTFVCQMENQLCVKFMVL
jgi:hypothetical protein